MCQKCENRKKFKIWLFIDFDFCVGLHKLHNSIEFVKTFFFNNFHQLCPTNMTVTGEPVKEIQVTVRVGLNPEVLDVTKLWQGLSNL